MIYEMLFDWQKSIVDKFKNRLSFGLFLDMGLGKTPLSLAFAEQNNCTKVIVITINSKAIESVDVGGSWLNWASKSSISYNLFSKTSKTQLYTPNSNDLLIVNYESLFSRKRDTIGTKLKDNIMDFIYSCDGHNTAIIVDESHKMKNLQSKQTKAIMQLKNHLLCRAKNVFTYLLTGTPFTTGYIDLYTQLKMLGYEENKGTFTDNFCIRGNLPGLLGWQQPIVGYKNVDLLFNLVHKYAITIKSEEVVDLPEKIFVNHIMPYTQQFKLFTYERIDNKDVVNELTRRHLPTDEYVLNKEKKVNNPFFRNFDYPDYKWLAETNGTFWLRARQLSIGFQGNAEYSCWYDKTRLQQLKQFVEDNEDNYIVFYNYTPELLELYDIFEQAGYHIDVYCGEVKSTFFYDRYTKMSEAEQLVNKKNVIIANFASGSTGMNWQAYNKCIIFSMPIYRDYEQGIKRIHRLGQKETTFYHIFYQNNWLDLGMKKALEQCIDYSQEMFDADLDRVQSIMEEKK